jgi:hypothetical protein
MECIRSSWYELSLALDGKRMILEQAWEIFTNE